MMGVQLGTQNIPYRAATASGHVVNLTSRSLRVALSHPVLRDGKEFYEVSVCVTGAWVKGSRMFSITSDDLADMVRNFEKRRNDQVVIDYEHASEQPEVARGGPVIAAGWIHQLTVTHSHVLPPGVTQYDMKADDRPHTSDRLVATVEWTPQAVEMIRSGQYRFFSPAIDWAYCDKQTGEPQGATLTSGALTNHPFLEELPAITLSDLDRTRAAGQATAAREEVRGWQTQRSAGREARLADATVPEVKETTMKRLTIKRLTDGELAGHHGVFDGDDALGYIDAGDFGNYLESCGAELPAAGSGAAASDLDSSASSAANETDAVAMSEILRELGVAADEPGQRREQLVDALQAAREAWAREQQAGARRLLLREAVREGALDSEKAAQLAREGRIALADYIAAQEADKKLAEAVRAGKILPRDRRFFFHDALERPREFSEYIGQAVPVVRLATEGLGTAGEVGVDDEVKMRVNRLMQDEKTSFARALRKVLAADRELENRYHSLHRKQVGCDPRLNGSAGRGITA